MRNKYHTPWGSTAKPCMLPSSSPRRGALSPQVCPFPVRFRGPSDVRALSFTWRKRFLLLKNRDTLHTCGRCPQPLDRVIHAWARSFSEDGTPVLRWTGSSQISNSCLILPCQSYHRRWEAGHFWICTKATVTDT